MILNETMRLKKSLLLSPSFTEYFVLANFAILKLFFTTGLSFINTRPAYLTATTT